MFVVGRKSIPWQEHEMIYINGTPCVYTVGSNGIRVHLPGGQKAWLTDLRAQKVNILEPRIWRKGDYI